MSTAEIIAIGSELLTPDNVDSNSLWLTAQLNDIGIEVKGKAVIGDDAGRLENAIREAALRSELVITTGGLGPTEDDLTRQCSAAAIGRELIYKDDIEAHLRERFRAWGREMPDINKRQAWVIAGCKILPNPNGSAVGMLTELESSTLVNLPGPPRENQPMFTRHVLPLIRNVAGSVFVKRRLLKVTGMGESAIDEIAAPIYSSFPSASTSILFNKTDVELHVSATSVNEAEASKTVNEIAAKLKDALGDAVFSDNGESMEEVVGRLLRERAETLSTAESCTGGLISRRVTEVAGSSSYFLEGAVTYSNEAKTRLLDVPAEMIEQFGAVSAQVAEAMAAGSVRSSGSDHAISVTGIAGPGGGSDEKPVGTVFLGYSNGHETVSMRIFVPGDRYLVRWRTSQAALDLLRRKLMKRLG